MSVPVARFYIECNPDQLFTFIDPLREKLNAQLDRMGVPREGREIVIEPGGEHEPHPDCPHEHHAGITLTILMPEDGAK